MGKPPSHHLSFLEANPPAGAQNAPAGGLAVVNAIGLSAIGAERSGGRISYFFSYRSYLPPMVRCAHHRLYYFTPLRGVFSDLPTLSLDYYSMFQETVAHKAIQGDYWGTPPYFTQRHASEGWHPVKQLSYSCSMICIMTGFQPSLE